MIPERISVMCLIIWQLCALPIRDPRATFPSLSGKRDKDYERADETLHLVDLIALAAKYTPHSPPFEFSPTVVVNSCSKVRYSVPFDLVSVMFAFGSQLWQVIFSLVLV